MKLFKVIFALVVVGIGYIAYQIYSKPTPRYFADIHIGPPTNPAQVQAFIIFDRVAKLDSPAGLAHYTEHLVAMSALADDFNAADRHANAYTSNVSVGYWVKGPKEDLPLMLENLGGVFDPISIDVKFANEEVDIVRREYDLRREDNINYSTYEAMTLFLYEGNDIGGLSHSTPESIALLDYEQAVVYYEAAHQQASGVLLVLGDVSERELQKALDASGIKPLTVPDAEIKPNAFVFAGPETKNFIFEKETAEPRIVFRKIVTLDKAVDFDFLQLQTSQLSAVLDTNLPGGIAGPLRYDNFIARSFEIIIYPIDEQSIELWFVASPDKKVSFEQLQLAFEDTMKSAGDGIAASTYKRVQDRSEQYWVAWEDEDATTKWMSEYVENRAKSLRSPLSLKELKKMAEQVTLEHTNTLLTALQKPGRQSVAYIGIDNGDDQ